MRDQFGVERNVGGVDRLARAVAAILFAGAGGVALASGRHTVGAGSLLVATALGFNAVTGFCGVNAVAGVDTCEIENEN